MNLVKRDAVLVGGGLLAILVGGVTIERATEESTEAIGSTVIVSGVAMMAAGYLSGYIGDRKVKAVQRMRPGTTRPRLALVDRARLRKRRLASAVANFYPRAPRSKRALAARAAPTRRTS